MGNCTSCVTSNIQIHEYGCLENSLHIQSAIGSGKHKVGSVHSQQGAKGLNQDSAVLYQGYGMEDGAFCAVFDGHGGNGHIVSRVVRNQLPSLLLNQRKFMDWNEALVSSFKTMDKEINLIETVDCSFSGSTAVIAVKQGEDLIIANLGDSRAVLGTLTENGIQATQLTKDHKPDVPSEVERIKKANGRVFAHESQPHIQRVWLPNEDVPGLAMTRAFGNFDMKSYGIIVTPEITHRRVTSEDQFLVLACDGVWDVLSNEEVVSIVRSVKNKEAAAKAVIDEALAAWKRKFPSAKVDDCTAVCLFLQEREDCLLLPTT
ncbi:probable protein phosphatase 2C 72 isoform X1 [Chenopodium quinoa]|uniref:probable protein phosphatase 2C 72 isoform X1 n=2 Tax=Chenopodium quinoa TaxID=63459 RepID=UPI000B77F6C1|nr:probable protein phosphatase 2C 72 isoform X1 [Chenopodium quinoa]